MHLRGTRQAARRNIENWTWTWPYARYIYNTCNENWCTKKQATVGHSLVLMHETTYQQTDRYQRTLGEWDDLRSTKLRFRGTLRSSHVMLSDTQDTSKYQTTTCTQPTSYYSTCFTFLWNMLQTIYFACIFVHRYQILPCLSSFVNVLKNTGRHYIFIFPRLFSFVHCSCKLSVVFPENRHCISMSYDVQQYILLYYAKFSAVFFVLEVVMCHSTEMHNSFES